MRLPGWHLRPSPSQRPPSGGAHTHSGSVRPEVLEMVHSPLFFINLKSTSLSITVFLLQTGHQVICPSVPHALAL